MGAIAASQKGRTPRTNAVGHHPEVVGVRVANCRKFGWSLAADLQHDLRLASRRAYRGRP